MGTKRALLCLFIVVVTLLNASTAFTEGTQTITINIVLHVPFVDRTALGTLVMQDAGTPDQIQSSWSFTGQVNGSLATASGLARGQWTGNSYDGNITSFKTWNMGGLPTPTPPMHMSVVTGTNASIYLSVAAPHGTFSLPLAVQGVGQLPAPFQGDLQLSITNRAGSPVIPGLPATGAVPDWLNLVALAFLLVGGGAIVASRSILRRGSPTG